MRHETEIHRQAAAPQPTLKKSSSFFENEGSSWINKTMNDHNKAGRNGPNPLNVSDYLEALRDLGEMRPEQKPVMPDLMDPEWIAEILEWMGEN